MAEDEMDNVHRFFDGLAMINHECDKITELMEAADRFGFGSLRTELEIIRNNLADAKQRMRGSIHRRGQTKIRRAIMPTKETIKKYHEIIDGGLFEEQEIISFRSLLREHFHDEQVKALFDKFNDNVPYALTEKQELKGIDWLRNRLLRKDGKIRDTEEIRELLAKSRNRLYALCNIVLNCADGSFNFYLVGLIDEADVHALMIGRSLFVPIYRLYDKQGNWVDYYYSIASGQLEILGCEYDT